MNKLVGLSLIFGIAVGFSACKPKQSAYKSVYEAAREREMEENENTVAAVVDKPVYPVYEASDYSDEKVRQEKITPVNDSDADGLRAYSVVIASLAVKPGAEALKAKMEADGYRVILAQNEQGMYRVIIASYDDKGQAVEKRNEIRSRYQSMGSTDYLRKTYGIPFDDLWVLQRQY